MENKTKRKPMPPLTTVFIRDVFCYINTEIVKEQAHEFDVYNDGQLYCDATYGHVCGAVLSGNRIATYVLRIMLLRDIISEDVVFD